MRLRDLALALDPASEEPLFSQIAKELVVAIKGGRLQSGALLPGSRAMAALLKVHRNTVIAAFRRLESEGWIETREGSGTFVASRSPSPKEASPQVPALGFDLPPRIFPKTEHQHGVFDLREDLPDVRLFPTELLARAYHHAMKRKGQDLLRGGDPRGQEELRQALAAFLAERRGLTVDPDQILVTGGGRMSLSLVALALLNQGDTVGVEDPGNRAVWETLRQARASLLALPVDGEGLRPENVETAIQAQGLRMLCLSPQGQVPTGGTLGRERRQDLLELAGRHRLAIVEEDASIEFTTPSQLPLAQEDRHGVVVYIASLSRMLAPGLRLGFLVAPRSLVDRLASVRRRLDWQGDRTLESALAELLRDGDLQRHLRRTRKVYEERRNLMAALLKDRFGAQLAFDVPDRGLAFWVRAEGFDLEPWRLRCGERGVLFHPARYFRFDHSPGPCTRIAFGTLEPEEIHAAVERMSVAMDEIKDSKPA